MSILSIKNLWKYYDNEAQPAVRDFSLEVEQGEMVAILGESGCGKTTILRMITGFEVQSRGSIRINGKTVCSDRLFVEPENRGVGIVFQDYALFPHKTVLENIGFGLFHLPRKQREEKVLSVMRMSGLEGLEKRYPHQLSGGQKQRVALARALAPEPKLILFDEPFSNIDTMRKHRIREDIQDIIRKTESTAIFVTHDTKDVLAIADRVSVLKEGVTLQTGSPYQIYSRPRNRYVADFFGKTNVLRAKTVEGGFDTPIGFIKSDTQLPATMDEVLLSIRPENFEIGSDDEECFCGSIKSENFLGDYKELVCEVKTPEGETAEVVIYAPPQQECENQTCWFRPKNDSPPGILEE